MKAIDEALLLVQIRDLLTHLSKATEDEKSSFAGPLRAFEAQHSLPVLDGQLSDALTEIYGLVAIELGLMKKAQDAFSILEARAHRKLQTARLRLAIICRKQKRPLDALAVLDSIEGKTRDRKLYRNEVERVRKELTARNWQKSLSLARALFISGDIVGAIAQIRISFASIGIDDVQADALMSAVAASMALYHASPDVRHEDLELTSPQTQTLPMDMKVLSISGFGWSGSGAVADFLKGREGIAFPFGGTELCCFEGFEKCAIGANTVLHVAHSGEIADLRRCAAMFVLSAFLMAIPAHEAATAAGLDRWRHKVGLSHILKHQTSLDGLAACCLNFLGAMGKISHISAREEIEARTEAALQRLFGDFLALVAGTDRVLVLNNCIHGYNIGLLRLLPDAVGLVVHRDPRDAFVARCYENTRTPSISVASFVKDLKKNYDSYYRQREVVINSERIVDIDFEDFLRDAGLRTGLLERLGLDASDTGTGALRLEISQRNIGIHAKYPDQTTIETIAVTNFRNKRPI